MEQGFFLWFKHLLEIFLHIDKYLGQLVLDYHNWTYAILFLVIFCETGLVVTPFLPGDSLLFAAGSLAGMGSLNPVILFILMASAAIIGDNVNYWVGNKLSKKLFHGNSKFLKKEYLDKTHSFYEKYGVKTIIIARFVPIVRTFSPFVAGVGAMKYPKFMIFDVFGGLLWTGLFIFTGYYFGSLQIVKNNFSFVVIAIVLISVLPIFIEYLRNRISKKSKLKINENSPNA